MDDGVENGKPRSLRLGQLSRVASALLIPPVGIAAALRIDGQSPGPLSGLAFWVLPILGLLILLPMVNGWPVRLMIAVAYLGVELLVMFLVGVTLACAWYRACL